MALAGRSENHFANRAECQSLTRVPPELFGEVVENSLIKHLNDRVIGVLALRHGSIEDTISHESHEARLIKVGFVSGQLLWIGSFEDYFGGDLGLLTRVELLKVVNDSDLVAPLLIC